MKSRLVAMLCIAAVVLGGCTQTQTKKMENVSFAFTAKEKRVLVIDPDVTLGELTAGGVVEARADWTATAKQLIVKHVMTMLDSKGIAVSSVDVSADERGTQLVKLHEVAGQAAAMHSIGMVSLPTKGKAFDWTLGPGTNLLRERYGADYALFIFVNDTYTSAGRAFMMLGAAMMGVSVPGGQQMGVASLVDLRNGNIVWLNFMMSGSGDLRNDASAQIVVKDLLTDLPL